MRRFFVLFVAVVLVLCGMVTAPAYAFNQASLTELLSSNYCKDCDLTNADLKKANLGLANLSGANLMGADREKADLLGADLTGANLMGTSLEKATMPDGSKHV